MDKTTRTSIEIIEASILLGVACNFLLRDVPLGVNVVLWVLLLLAASRALISRWRPALWTTESALLYAAALFFASMFAFFDSFELLLVDGLAIAAILAVISMPALRSSFRNSKKISYTASAAASAISSMIGPLFVILDDIKWNTLPRTGVAKYVFDVLRGFLIALPVVIIIGALLMSADAMFESFVTDTFKIDPETVFVNVAFTGFVAWAVLGYLRAVVFGVRSRTKSGIKQFPEHALRDENEVKSPGFSVTEHTTEDPSRDPDQEAKKHADRPGFKPAFPGFLRVGMVEICIVLGLMNAVFLAFVIFQLPYLFGGIELVQQTPDLKLSEYARRGVGELLAVGLIVLPVLLALHWLLRKDKPLNEKVFRAFASVQIGLLFVVIWSAAQRLLLLTGVLGYGMTTFRFYAMFLLIWLALVFAWFGITVLRGKRAQFAYGAFWSGLFIAGMLNVVNPDAFIVERNIELMQQGRSFDAGYNASLSADAAPVLIGSLELMSAEDRKSVVLGIESSACRWGAGTDFRSFNRSRNLALSIMAANGMKTRESDCID